MNGEPTIYPDAPEEHCVRTLYGSGGEGWEHLEERLDELKEEIPDPDCIDFRIEVFDYDVEVSDE